MKQRNLAGQTFGRLSVLRSHLKDGRRTFWWTVCLCGAEKAVRTDHLTSGRVSSCGCLSKETTAARMRTHGMSRGKAHRVHEAMRRRCNNEADPAYHRYGGRGITICPEWRKFEDFYADMGDPPPGLTIERKDNNGPYCKSNCVWATKREQAGNTRRNVFVEFGGRRQPVSAWARELGLDPSTLLRRLKAGWTAGEALAKPVRPQAARRTV